MQALGSLPKAMKSLHCWACIFTESYEREVVSMSAYTIFMYVCLIFLFISWNIITILDIKETIEINKRPDHSLGWEDAEIQNSSFWCIVFDSVLILFAIAIYVC